MPLDISILGWARTEYGKDARSIPEMVYDVVRRAMDDAGVTRDDIDYVVTAGIDLFEGNIASNVYLVEVTGSVLKEEVRIADDGAAAVFHASAILNSGSKNTVLCVACCKNTETDPDMVTPWFTDPIYIQPLGAGDTEIAALQQDLWLHNGGSKEDVYRITAMRRSVSIESVKASPVLIHPIHQLERAPLTDGACALLLGKDSGKGISLIGAGLCVEPHYIGERDLIGCPGLYEAFRNASRMANISYDEINIAEISAQFAHQEIIYRKVLKLNENCGINPSNGWFAGNPYVVAGLERVICAVEGLIEEKEKYALAHGTWGPGGQGHAILLLKRED